MARLAREHHAGGQLARQDGPAGRVGERHPPADVEVPLAGVVDAGADADRVPAERRAAQPRELGLDPLPRDPRQVERGPELAHDERAERDGRDHGRAHLVEQHPPEGRRAVRREGERDEHPAFLAGLQRELRRLHAGDGGQRDRERARREQADPPVGVHGHVGPARLHDHGGVALVGDGDLALDGPARLRREVVPDGQGAGPQLGGNRSGGRPEEGDRQPECGTARHAGRDLLRDDLVGQGVRVVGVARADVIRVGHQVLDADVGGDRQPAGDLGRAGPQHLVARSDRRVGGDAGAAALRGRLGADEQVVQGDLRGRVLAGEEQLQAGVGVGVDPHAQAGRAGGLHVVVVVVGGRGQQRDRRVEHLDAGHGPGLQGDVGGAGGRGEGRGGADEEGGEQQGERGCGALHGFSGADAVGVSGPRGEARAMVSTAVVGCGRWRGDGRSSMRSVLAGDGVIGGEGLGHEDRLQTTCHRDRRLARRVARSGGTRLRAIGLRGWPRGSSRVGDGRPGAPAGAVRR